MKFLYIFVFISSFLFAGPPMKSNDPFVPSYGEYEINVAVEIEDKDFTLVRAPIIDFNYGIYENVQFTFEGAYVNSDLEDDFDSLEVAFKWHFYEGELFSIALYPKYISYPIESIFNEGETYELTLPMNYILTANLDLVVDITYVYPKNGIEHMEYGTYLKYKINKHTYYTEIFFEDSPHQKGAFILGNLGYMYHFHKDVAFMISAGREMVSDGKKATLGYSGLQIIF